jgi:ABC-type sugar transport system substrate-binding protein
MKNFSAALLAILLIVSLTACAGTSANAPAAPSASAESSESLPIAEATPASDAGDFKAGSGTTGEDPLDLVGFYDPSVDYTKFPRFRIKYMVASVSYDESNKAVAHWCDKFNIEYNGCWGANGDNELFINNIYTFAKENDGLICDPDSTVFTRVKEVLDELQIPWMSFNAPPRDMSKPDQPMFNPYVGFDFVWFGDMQNAKLLEYKNTAWPDVPWENVGWVVLDFSVVPVIHVRFSKCEQEFIDAGGKAENYFYLDSVTGGMNIETANNLVTSTVSTADPNITHWLCTTVVDPLAFGAASAFDSLGLTDNACVVCAGGSDAAKQWDAGQHDAFRFALLTPQNIYAEPIVGALHAFMAGLATPETIWPSWVNENDHFVDGNEYASLLLPSFWLDEDTYRTFLAWSDVYAGANQYPDYDHSGIARDLYIARMEVPLAYKKA